MNYEEILQKLQSLANPENVKGMAHFGISPKNNLGISVPRLRALAKEIGRNHTLALQLWNSGIHDARLLAVFIDNPKEVTTEQMEQWATDFDSWDICDQACTSLFDKTAYAWEKVYEWAQRDEEFVKRGAFSLIAGLAVHDKTAKDAVFIKVLSVIKQHSVDERNYVKKAVNWALRNIGKRNRILNKKAVIVAQELTQEPSRSARWIGRDAVRELTNEKIQKRVEKKKR